MKKIFITLSFIFTVCFLNAQTGLYHPLPDSAQWNYYGRTHIFIGSFIESWHTCEMNADTIINSIIYSKITSPGKLTYNPPLCPFPPGPDTLYFVPDSLLGCIREDTAQKKIYCILPNSTNEELLYDFSLQINDTVTGILGYNHLGYADIIQSIDSILIGSNYHKRFLVNPFYSIYWIEGVGSTAGFFSSSPGNIMDLEYVSLTCFKANGQSVFTSGTQPCNIITHTPKTMKNNFSFSTYPNPAKNLITITSNDNFRPYRYKLVNITGQVLCDAPIYFDNNQLTIPVSDLLPGLYGLQLSDSKNNTSFSKFIKE